MIHQPVPLPVTGIHHHWPQKSFAVFLHFYWKKSRGMSASEGPVSRSAGARGTRKLKNANEAAAPALGTKGDAKHFQKLLDHFCRIEFITVNLAVGQSVTQAVRNDGNNEAPHTTTRRFDKKKRIRRNLILRQRAKRQKPIKSGARRFSTIQNTEKSAAFITESMEYFVKKHFPVFLPESGKMP